MSQPEPPPGPPRTAPCADPPPGHGVAVVLYVLSAAAVAAAAGLLTGRLSPALLAAGLGLYLGAVGVLLLRRRRPPSHLSSLRYRDIMPVYMTVQDRSYRILDANEPFRRDFGASIGERCYRAYKGRDSICPGCPVARTFVDGKVHTTEENVVTLDGRQASMMVHSVPILDDKGFITSVMELSTNVTEVKRMQRQLALMGMAVAGTAHRIKNILMGLEGGVFVMNTGFETDDQTAVADGWDMVQRNVSRVSRMVKDLLYCSKERTPHFCAGVSLAEVLRDVVDDFRARAAAERIDFDLRLDPALRPGEYDPGALRNLVSNLVANAVDACRFDPDESKQRHHIRLSCRPCNDEGAILEVSDDGVGVPEEASDKVFEGFFSTKGTEGTGLGLLVVQKIAEEHGGAVSFSSSPGHGATFQVTLPPRGRRPPPPPPARLADPGAGTEDAVSAPAEPAGSPAPAAARK